MAAVDRASDLNALPPFPTLFDAPLDTFEWPAPPIDWRHEPPPRGDAPQACTIETPRGATVEGWLVGIEPARGQLRFRAALDGSDLTLPLHRVRRLVLAQPLGAVDRGAGLPTERVPAAAHERDYRLVLADGAGERTGRTTGHVETPDGLFLFEPGADGRTLTRVFVPRPAYARCSFGPSAQDLAAESWVATPQALLDALERQRRTPVRPLGQSLLDLGLVTPWQLEQALAEKDDDAPLGEALVARGVLSKGDLQTAIAHKMGYPFVDLTRFPIDPAAARRLPLRHAVSFRALPILQHGDRLVVAMDRPARAAAVQSLYAIAPLKVVAVLASKGQLLLALSSLAGGDLWAETVSIRAGFFASTLH